jgi:molybdate transport system regulatory protein
MASGSDPENTHHRPRGGMRSHNQEQPGAAGAEETPGRVRAVHLAHRVWLERDGVRVFGPGAYELLRRVEQMGSLNRASKSMAMSYSKAWRVVREVEERLGVSLFERRVGGSDGGGSSLTDEARSLLARYTRLAAEVDDLLAELFFEHFSGTSYGPAEPPARRAAAGEHEVR